MKINLPDMQLSRETLREKVVPVLVKAMLAALAALFGFYEYKKVTFFLSH